MCCPLIKTNLWRKAINSNYLSNILNTKFSQGITKIYPPENNTMSLDNETIKEMIKNTIHLNLHNALTATHCPSASFIGENELIYSSESAKF